MARPLFRVQPAPRAPCPREGQAFYLLKDLTSLADSARVRVARQTAHKRHTQEGTMSRTIRHAELEGYGAKGEEGFIYLHNDNGEQVMDLPASKLKELVAILKVAARDALKTDSSAEFVVKARSPRSPNKTNKK